MKDEHNLKLLALLGADGLRRLGQHVPLEHDAQPVPKMAPGVVAFKQAGLLGFLVRPKPSTEPAVLPAAAVGGAE